MRLKRLDQGKSDSIELTRHYQKIDRNTLSLKLVTRVEHPVLSLGDNPGIAPRYELAPDIRRLIVTDGVFLVFYRLKTDVEVLLIRQAEHLPVAVGNPNQAGT